MTDELQTPEDVFGQVLDQILQSMPAELQNALRLCAVVHWFDAGLLGALLGDDEQAGKYLVQLRRYTFVDALPGGRWVLHDNVRANLLKRWQETPEAFREANARAFEAFDRRAEAAPGDDLLQRERVYHQLAADREAGLREGERLFENAVDEFRLEQAELLLGVLGERGEEDWRRYLQARLLYAQADWFEAREMLDGLDAGGLDEDLAARVRVVQGDVEVKLGQWTEAIGHYEASLAYFEGLGDGVWAARVMVRLGDAYADFAYNMREAQEVGYGYSRPVRWLRVLGPLGAILLRVGWWLLQAGRFAGNFPVSLYQWWKMRGKLSFWQYPWPLLFGRTKKHFVYQALEWYFAAADRLGGEELRHGIRLRVAELLARHGSRRAALILFAQLAEDEQADLGRHRRAGLDLARARLHLRLGELEEALPLMETALAVFEDYGDRYGLARAYRLRGRYHFFTGGAQAAQPDYQRSTGLYKELDAPVELGRLVEEVDQLEKWQGKRRMKKQGASMVTALGLDEEKLPYFSRPPLSKWLNGTPGWLALGILIYLLAVNSSRWLDRVDSALSWLASRDPFWLGLLLYVLGMVILVLVIIGLMLMISSVIEPLFARYFLTVARMERYSPQIYLLSDEGFKRAGYDGVVQFETTWRNIRYVLLKSGGLTAGNPIPAMNSLEFHTRGSEVIKISGFTSRYPELLRRFRQYLAAEEITVSWRQESITMPKYVFWMGLFYIWALILVVTLFLLPSISQMTNRTIFSVYGFILEITVLLLVPIFVWAMFVFGRRYAQDPDRAIPWWVLGAGYSVLAGYFLVPVVQELGRPFSFAAVLMGFAAVYQAGVWLLRPRYLTKKKKGQMTRPRLLLLVVLLLATVPMLVQFVRVDLQQYYLLSRIYVQGVFDSSFEELDEFAGRAEALKPEDPWLYLGLAMAYYSEDDFEQVVAVSTRGLVYAEGNPVVTGFLKNIRAPAHYYLGDLERAVADFAASRQYEIPVTNFEARGLALLGRMDEAEALLDADEPEDTYDYVTRGRNYFGIGLYEKALADFEQVGYVNYLRDEIAQALAALGRRDEAVEVIEGMALESFRDYRDQGDAYYLIGELELAEAAFEAARAISDEPSLGLRFARVYLAQGRYEDAEAAVRPALEAGYSTGDAYLGLALAGQGDPEAGLALLNEVVDDPDDDPRFYYYRGLVYQMLGEDELAAADFEHVLQQWTMGELALWEVEGISGSGGGG